MKWFIVVVALATIAFAVHAQVPTKPDLVGQVISPPGKSVKATAVLCYWQPKPGKQPSDMGDLPRHVQADEQGNFKFQSLDPSLRIPGYQLTPKDALLKSGSSTNLTVITNVTGLLIEMKPATSFEP